MEGRECRIGNPGSGWGGGGGRWLGLRVGVFGTLVTHSPKVAQLDFSVKVMRHKLKILSLWKTLEEKNASGLGKRFLGSVASGPYFSSHCITYYFGLVFVARINSNALGAAAFR